MVKPSELDTQSEGHTVEILLLDLLDDKET